MTKEPATAKEFMSIPISFKISSPKNKKPIMITAAIREAFSDWIWPTFSLNEMMRGMLPMISITANSRTLAVRFP